MPCETSTIMDREALVSPGPVTLPPISQSQPTSNTTLGAPPASLAPPDYQTVRATPSPLPLPPPAILPPAHGLARDPILPPFPDPAVPALAPIQSPQEKTATGSHQTLPSLSSITSPRHDALPSSPPPPAPAKAPNHWPSLNPFTAYYAPSHVQEPPMRLEPDPAASRRAGSVSLDDPDVRMAAEALDSLKTDFSSPRHRNTSLPPTPSATPQSGEPVPVLSILVKTSHSAYNTSKNYSPRFKQGAEYVETYLSPVAERLGRYLHGKRHRHPSDVESGEERKGKWLKSDVEDGAVGPRRSSRDDGLRRLSSSTIDTLPAYEAEKPSPEYSETADGRGAPGPGSSAGGGKTQQLVVMTSGLAVAISPESMKNIKHCLGVLKDANSHFNQLVLRLQESIVDLDRAATRAGKEGDDQVMAEAGGQPASLPPPDRSEVVARINQMKKDAAERLRMTIKTISQYGAVALPENVKQIVTQHLTGLASAWNTAKGVVGQRSGGVRDQTRDMTHMLLIFIKDSLETIRSMSDLLNRVVESAEKWCQTGSAWLPAPNPEGALPAIAPAGTQPGTAPASAAQTPTPAAFVSDTVAAAHREDVEMTG